MPTGIWIIAGADGRPVKGWLSAYDPDSNDGQGDVQVTRDAGLAKRFGSVMEAWDYWRQQSKIRPVRHDQQPNRPLTAFTIELRPIEDGPVAGRGTNAASGKGSGRVRS